MAGLSFLWLGNMEPLLMNHGIGVGAVDVLLEYDSGVCPTLIKFKGLIEHV